MLEVLKLVSQKLKERCHNQMQELGLSISYSRKENIGHTSCKKICMNILSEYETSQRNETFLYQ